MFRKTKKIVTIFFLFIAIFLMLSYETIANASILSFLIGTAPRNGIFYLPYGFHTTKGDYKGQSRPRDFRSVHLLGGIYQSIFLTTFINSFDDRVFAFGIERDLFQLYQINMGYAAGLIYGYEGRLAYVKDIPLRKTFIFKHNINPFVALISHIRIYDHLELEFVIEPLVIAGGIKITF